MGTSDQRKVLHMIHPLFATQKVTDTEVIRRHCLALENDLESLSPEETIEIISKLDLKTCFHYPKAIQIAHKIAPLFRHTNGEPRFDYFTEPDDCTILGEKVTGTIPVATENEIKQELFRQMFGDEEGNLDELFQELKVPGMEIMSIFFFTEIGKIRSTYSVQIHGDFSRSEYYQLLARMNNVIAEYFSKNWRLNYRYPQVWRVPSSIATLISVSELDKSSTFGITEISKFSPTDNRRVFSVAYDTCASNVASEILDLKVSWKLINTKLRTFPHSTSYVNRKIMISLETILFFFNRIILPSPAQYRYCLKEILRNKCTRIAFSDTNFKTSIIFITQIRSFVEDGYQLVGNRIIITDQISDAKKICDSLVNKNWNELKEFDFLFTSPNITECCISNIFCFLSVIHHLKKLSYSFTDLNDDDHHNLVGSCFCMWVSIRLYTIIQLGMNDTLLDLIHLNYPFQKYQLDINFSQDKLPNFSSELIDAENHNDVFETLIDYQLLPLIVKTYPSSINLLLYPKTGRWQDFQKSDSLMIIGIKQCPEILPLINRSNISARLLQESLYYQHDKNDNFFKLMQIFAERSALEHLVVLLTYLERHNRKELISIVQEVTDYLVAKSRKWMGIFNIEAVAILDISLGIFGGINDEIFNDLWKISTSYVREWISSKVPEFMLELLTHSEIEPDRVSSFCYLLP